MRQVGREDGPKRVAYGGPVLPAPRRPVDSPAAGQGDADVDQWLAGKAKEGDVDAFEALVRRHRAQIYRIALRIVGNPQDAQDVTQDVLIQLWGSLGGFLGHSAFTTWLYRMVVNRSLNHRKRHPRTVSLLEVDRPAIAGADQEVIARRRMHATSQAIAALPAEQRAVVVLHQLEGFSYADTAAILAIPESTVRGRLARGRRALADQLKDWA